MHPIERLRYVARASGVPQAILVRETASALMSFAREPQELVTACRRMISRQPASGPLLWLTSRVLSSTDPARELRNCLDALDGDKTSRELRYALPDDCTIAVLGWPDAATDALPARGDLEVLVVDVLGEGTGFVQRLWQEDVAAVDVPVGGLGAGVAEVDVLLLESSAIGPDEFLGVAGSRAAAAVAHHRGTPVWLVGGVGRQLPGPLWASLRARVATDDPWDVDEEVVPLDLVTHIVGPEGVFDVAEALQNVDCPVAAELLRDAI
ncbi:MAG: hypothetical protein ACR2PK_16200 [Acidimicrobiales bacterium]